MIIFWNFENKNAVDYAREGRLLFQLQDMQFSYLLVNLNRHLTNLFAYCKINDLEIIFILQGFLIFALHCMRNTQVRKETSN